MLIKREERRIVLYETLHFSKHFSFFADIITLTKKLLQILSKMKNGALACENMRLRPLLRWTCNDYFYAIFMVIQRCPKCRNKITIYGLLT